MARPRKKWEPSYHFGGSRISYLLPGALGEHPPTRPVIKKPKPKRKKK